MAADEDENDGGFVAIQCAWSRLGCAPALRKEVDDVLRRMHSIVADAMGPQGRRAIRSSHQADQAVRRGPLFRVCLELSDKLQKDA